MLVFETGEVSNGSCCIDFQDCGDLLNKFDLGGFRIRFDNRAEKLAALALACGESS